MRDLDECILHAENEISQPSTDWKVNKVEDKIIEMVPLTAPNGLVGAVAYRYTSGVLILAITDASVFAENQPTYEASIKKGLEALAEFDKERLHSHGVPSWVTDLASSYRSLLVSQLGSGAWSAVESYVKDLLTRSETAEERIKELEAEVTTPILVATNRLADQLADVRTSLGTAKIRIDALKDALQDLMDEQNGPPLIRDEEAWEAAMEKARIAVDASRRPMDL